MVRTGPRFGFVVGEGDEVVYFAADARHGSGLAPGDIVEFLTDPEERIAPGLKPRAYSIRGE